MRKILIRIFLWGLCLAPAMAGQLTVVVKDAAGKPAADAVVEVLVNVPSRVPQEARIDQRVETFLPLVSIIRKGGHVGFLNNDTTMHQVYSFSAIKQFQFELRQGQRSAPVVFDVPGVAAIGCNIHDSMITYVYVADAPLASLTDAAGKVVFADIPEGAVQLRAWHPRLAQPLPLRTVTVGAATMQTLALPVTIPSASHQMHMGSY